MKFAFSCHKRKEAMTRGGIIISSLVSALAVIHAILYWGDVESSYITVGTVIASFWLLIILCVTLLFWLRSTPIVIVPIFLATAMVLALSANDVLTWTAWSIGQFAP